MMFNIVTMSNSPAICPAKAVTTVLLTLHVRSLHVLRMQTEPVHLARSKCEDGQMQLACLWFLVMTT
jgi:hypothetical protein